ncbi:ABC transporter ATP-binding protein [Kocuria sp. M1R5S2]|uniref:ABC transporter ATP-binding protein n=1 Tax=Kocuria rhizosphaerae TaxID=3376285 RepID=UPI00378F2B47
MQLLTGANTDQGPLATISRITGAQTTQELVIVMAGLVGGAFVLKSLATLAFRWWLLGKTTAMEAEAATELMRRYLAAPYWAHRQRKVAEIHRTLASSVAQTFGQVFLGIFGLVADLLTILLILALLFWVSPLATLLAAVFFFLLSWGVQRSLKPHHRRIGEAGAQSDLDAWAALMPGLSGFRESRMAGKGSLFVERFRRAKVDRARANRKLSLVNELPKYALEVGLVVGIALIALVLFSRMPVDGAISVLGVFAVAATRILPVLNRVTAAFGAIRAGRVALEILVDEVEELEAHGSFQESAGQLRRFSGDIEVHDVTFRFQDSDDLILRRVNTAVPEGSTVAFVGTSGAGKSTLLDIILGLLDPTSGSVTCGGTDVRADLPSWYAGLGVVPQDVFLLDDTVAANIAFGESAATIDHDRLRHALDSAQLTDLIGHLSEGLETRLGERGIRLSGGQRQRIGIARALYREPSVLVLDEATSALDNITERQITDTIASLRGSMTIILVAHRLSTVRHADKVVFMAEGTIQTEGTFVEVEQVSPEFARLVELGRLA